jgi:pSer/pThr/pTyr-binding forkhead associated (FHA) protein
VSRRHVYLQVVEGQAFWIDLDSRSGTLGDGQLKKFGWLVAGKVLRVGPFELQRLVEDSSGAEDLISGSRPPISPLVARAHVSQPLPEVVLEFLNGPSQSACWPMNRVMSLIGSASGCKFRLADPSVAPFHCGLLRTPLGLWVVDLLAPEGIGVNDALVRYALLADKDVLRVGRYRIRIRSRFASRDQSSHSASDLRIFLPAPGAPWGDSSGPGFPGDEPVIPGFPALNPTTWAEPVTRRLTTLQSAVRASDIDWVSPDPNEPVRLQRGELTESVLVPLVNQFGVMQQQMLDQFQQAISMLVQMFGSMHRDQMERIREELDQLRDLTKEFHSLKLELTARSQGQVPSSPINPSPAAARVLGGQASMPGVNQMADAMIGTAAAHPSSTHAQAAPVASASKGLEGSPPLAAKSSFDSSNAERRGGAEAQPRTGSTPGSDREVIVWLHQRMATLQQERETRWQKILKLLPGLS